MHDMQANMIVSALFVISSTLEKEKCMKVLWMVISIIWMIVAMSCL